MPPVMITTLALIIAVFAGAWFWHRSAPPERVAATIVSSRFQSERAADGRTVTTIETSDGRRLTLSEPGRRSHPTGAAVRAEIRRGTLVRLSVD